MSIESQSSLQLEPIQGLLHQYMSSRVFGGDVGECHRGRPGPFVKALHKPEWVNEAVCSAVLEKGGLSSRARDMSQVRPSGAAPFSWMSFTPTLALGRSPVHGPSLTSVVLHLCSFTHRHPTNLIHAGSQPCFCQGQDKAWATTTTHGKEQFTLAPVPRLSYPALPPAAIWCR